MHESLAKVMGHEYTTDVPMFVLDGEPASVLTRPIPFQARSQQQQSLRRFRGVGRLVQHSHHSKCDTRSNSCICTVELNVLT